MSNWTESDNKLKAQFSFADFKQAFAFMTEVALHAETQGHHPEWFNVYNRVEISLSTHDAGNIVTDQDRQLAQKIDQVYARF